MRVGQNPAKSIAEVAQPEKVTVAIVVYIPFLSGYYAESLDVLKVCLGSLWENTDLPYDLLVFDNASCPEVRHFLTNAQAKGRIRYLVLSEKNIGKAGAWNFIFGGAPGGYIAYADSDVYFHPGWLSNQLALFDLFPKLGMVTGAPLRIPQEFSTSTLEWAEHAPDVQLERGVLLSWEDWWKHAQSLGVTDEEEGRELYAANEDACLQYKGKRYFIGASHFQFIARRAVLQSILPIPARRPMGQVRALDIAINERGYLRLSTPEWWVEHLGNRVPARKSLPSSGETAKLAVKKKNRVLNHPLIRQGLLRLYDRIFRLYFEEK